MNVGSKSSHLQSFVKHLRLTLVFICNSALRGKKIFYFSRVFLLVSTKVLFFREDWALGYCPMKFRHFLDIS